MAGLLKIKEMDIMLMELLHTLLYYDVSDFLNIALPNAKAKYVHRLDKLYGFLELRVRHLRDLKF